ncbi:hypothetical protein, partial [Rhizobium sp. L58/93]|uniref:hypothetical protein n=1 Tax=Rhizobium sp. L58/93 TaxID=2820000 RepID=UPI001ADC7DF6
MVVKDGLTVERHFEILVKKMVQAAEEVMRIETRGAPSWPGFSLRPDTLAQTCSNIDHKALADGASHTF